MAKTIRLNDDEEIKLRTNTLAINKDLVKMNKVTMRDTDLFHKIMNIVLINGKISVNEEGKIKIILE